jgi:hypothetical protein
VAGFVSLTFDCVAEIFNGFADFAFRFAVAFLKIALGAVSGTFRFEICIVNRSADYFLGFAFSLVQFAFELVSIW